jgi:hypothetical protein
MRRLLIPMIAALAFATGGCARPADASRPVVVELFTAQGCSSCPPANANLAAIADRPDVLALSFSVTYWDQLGWKDTFAQPRFTQRQWDYAHAFGRSNVFTPQTVVNGRVDGTGTQPGQIEAMIRRAGPAGGPDVTLTATEAVIGQGPAPARPAQVWLVRYDPRTVSVPIHAGENNGRTLPHRNVVHELILIGAWSGQAETLRLPPPTAPGLSSAVLIQAGPGGPILSAAKG